MPTGGSVDSSNAFASWHYAALAGGGAPTNCLCQRSFFMTVEIRRTAEELMLVGRNGYPGFGRNRFTVLLKADCNPRQARFPIGPVRPQRLSARASGLSLTGSRAGWREPTPPLSAGRR